MSLVRSKDTRPEKDVRRYLHARGYRFRLHRKDLPGQPDVVLPKYGLAIFVHGCFWHGHSNCSKGRTRPKTRADFWNEKIEGNQRRDRASARALRRDGWKVLIIWECETRDQAKLDRRLRRSLDAGR